MPKGHPLFPRVRASETVFISRFSVKFYSNWEHINVLLVYSQKQDNCTRLKGKQNQLKIETKQQFTIKFSSFRVFFEDFRLLLT